MIIAPGSTVGVLGGGQLGRMFAMAARRLGYRVHTLAPEHDTPTGQIADVEVYAAYDDLDAVSHFARGVDVATFEFENVPAAAAAAAEAHAIGLITRVVPPAQLDAAVTELSATLLANSPSSMRAI